MLTTLLLLGATAFAVLVGRLAMRLPAMSEILILDDTELASVPAASALVPAPRQGTEQDARASRSRAAPSPV